MEGGGREEFKKKMETDFLPTLAAEMAVWPLFQTFNFIKVRLAGMAGCGWHGWPGLAGAERLQGLGGLAGGCAAGGAAAAVPGQQWLWPALQAAGSMARVG
jgi:hypothetical protein